MNNVDFLDLIDKMYREHTCEEDCKICEEYKQVNYELAH